MPVEHRLHKLIAKKEYEEGERLRISDVADGSGVSRQTLYFWMANKQLKRIDSDTVEKLCAYFDVGVGELIEVVNE